MDTSSNSTAYSAHGYPVHLGLWINWTHGPILGASLTTTRQNAALLVAFTSTYIGFVATRVWRILCFILHRLYSVATPQNAGYHRIQAILCNASAPEDGARLALKLLSTRPKTHHRRIIFVGFTAIALVASFTALGGFSSRIALDDNDVLIESANCGFVYGGTEVNWQDYFAETEWLAKKVNNAANYAQQCYSSSSSSSQFDCDTFAAPRIDSRVELNAPCPFDSTLCLTDEANIRIDSGYVDSHTYLGLNAPLHKRVFWRNVLHCVPLATKGFTSLDPQSPTNDTLYHYGRLPGSNGTYLDYAYRMPSVEFQYVTQSVRDSLPVVSDFLPVDLFLRKDADIYLVPLSANGIYFSDPTDDIWFNVSKTTHDYTDTGGNIATFSDETVVYLPGAPSSPLACTDQYQFCDSNDITSNCGPLASFRDALAGGAAIFTLPFAQVATGDAGTDHGARYAYLIDGLLNGGGVYNILAILGPSALSLKQNLNGRIQGLLASNQWQVEVEHWWNITMTSIQGIFLDTAYGLNDPSVQALRVNYTTPEFHDVCHNQKIKSTSFTTLNFFGLVLTYVVGFILAFISYALEQVFGWLHRRRAYKQFKHLEWTSDTTLQLQRLAYEGIGQGTWSRGTRAIPTTDDGELLALLDISNLEHPVLRPLDKPEA
ncbi:hypothetical protein GGR57DRAFT_491761 [Xylariaceae sp. FL1272]|nr:hypothetical protein GGR57DRAFT_491761 [Xylariaceae sp. FL1272]